MTAVRAVPGRCVCTMKYRWVIAAVDHETVALLSEAMPELRGASGSVLCQCLANRGLTTPESARAFLWPRLAQLGDPFLLPDMDRAIQRVLEARELHQRVVIFGDYDVDGLTATAILTEVLEFLGLQVAQYLPHRLEEGYGLSLRAALNCHRALTPDLVIAVDCGSTATEAIRWLRQAGVDVIVIDHHNVKNPLPPALAIVNPHRADSTAPELATTTQSQFKELCSAGLAFKFAHALIKRARELQLPGAFEFDLKNQLDLVALGTVADAVPLTGQNRIMLRAGLHALNRTRRPGILALKKVTQSPEPLGVYEIGFQLAPRLNAAGRLDTATAAFALLTTHDPTEATRLAELLDSHNKQRQELERHIMDQVMKRLQSMSEPPRLDTDHAIVLGDHSWHIGVIGIVASRLAQQFHRPAIIMGGAGAYWRGSARSIPGFDLVSALKKCEDLLIAYGGHPGAAGISIDPAHVPAFAERFRQIAQQTIAQAGLGPTLHIDAEITLRDVTLELVETLELLKPNGIGNPIPRFILRRLTTVHPPRRIGTDAKHAKLWVTDGRITCPAIWWDAADEPLPTGVFDLACTLTKNEYEGRVWPQIEVLDWRPSRPAPD